MSILQQGTLLGKLPGMKEWKMYYVEVTPTHLHILDEHGKKHLRSLEIDCSDMCGEDTKSKKEFRFYLLRSDGKYTFRCDRPQDKTTWVTRLQSVIHTKTEDGQPLTPITPLTPPSRPQHKISALDTPLPAAPSPRDSMLSIDSGIGASEGGEVKRGRRGVRSAPGSGAGKFIRGNDSNSDGPVGRPPVHVVAEESEMSYEKCKWFWGTSSRQEAERRLLSEGKVGNFIVRINASGHYVMTYWRKDGIHHHKILNHGTIFRFEKSAVEAEGESLVDLLDTYMKANSAKKMEPFGGALYEMYNYAWTPPTFDMNLLEERLKEQKRLREEAKASQRPNQYTPVDIAETSSGSSREDSGSGSFNSPGMPTKAARGKTLPSPPAKKPDNKGLTSSVEESTITAGKAKPLPPTPKKKPEKQSSGAALQGAAFLQELKSKGQAGRPSPKPKPTAKPAKKDPQPSHPTPSHVTPPTHRAQPVNVHEPPEYGNVGFGPDKGAPTYEQPPVEPAEDPESLYMNMMAPQPPPTRKNKPRGVPAQPAPSEYQNIGTHGKGKRRH